MAKDWIKERVLREPPARRSCRHFIEKIAREAVVRALRQEQRQYEMVVAANVKLTAQGLAERYKNLADGYESGADLP